MTDNIVKLVAKNKKEAVTVSSCLEQFIEYCQPVANEHINYSVLIMCDSQGLPTIMTAGGRERPIALNELLGLLEISKTFLIEYAMGREE